MSNGHLKPSADRQSLGLTQVPRQVNLAVENQRIGLREDQQETIVLIPSTTVLNWLVVYHGIPTPLKNMSSSVGMILPNIWKNMFQTTNQYMMCTITTFNYSNARGTNQLSSSSLGVFVDKARNPEPTNVSSSWLTVYSTATLPISKNGEVIWGINNSNCELTIQVNMEDVTQLTTEALHNFGLNYCSHSPGSSPTQHATGLESWSETQWKSPACHQRQNINVCICFRINYWFVTSTVVIWFVTIVLSSPAGYHLTTSGSSLHTVLACWSGTSHQSGQRQNAIKWESQEPVKGNCSGRHVCIYQPMFPKMSKEGICCVKQCLIYGWNHASPQEYGQLLELKKKHIIG